MVSRGLPSVEGTWKCASDVPVVRSGEDGVVRFLNVCLCRCSKWYEYVVDLCAVQCFILSCSYSCPELCVFRLVVGLWCVECVVPCQLFDAVFGSA